MEYPSEYPTEYVLKSLREAPPGRKLCLVEGIAGSGKSTLAAKLAAAWGETTLNVSTDAFIKITRREWADQLAAGPIRLNEWFDIPRVQRMVDAFFIGKNLTLDGLYNLTNGRHDLQVDYAMDSCDLLIIEGLFAFDERLRPRATTTVFLEFDFERAKEMARQRDLVDRNLAPELFALKEKIYFDAYHPHSADFRGHAEHVLSRS